MQNSKENGWRLHNRVAAGEAAGWRASHNQEKWF